MLESIAKALMIELFTAVETEREIERGEQKEIEELNLVREGQRRPTIYAMK